MAEERVQRRLAAILSADVVGYSRLMGTDETGTLARLKAMRRDFFDPLSRPILAGSSNLWATARWWSSGAPWTLSPAQSRSRSRSKNAMRAVPRQPDTIPDRHQCR